MTTIQTALEKAGATALLQSQKDAEYQKMAPDLKSQWIAALLSGKYKQGKELLHFKNKRNEDRFCCLGVLADIRGEKWTISERRDKECIFRIRIESLQSPGGFYEEDSIYGPPGVLDESAVDVLTGLNDTGKRFTTIAKWISENL